MRNAAPERNTTDCLWGAAERTASGLYDCSTREQEINAPLPAQPRVQAPDAPLLLQPRADRRRRAAGALGKPGNLRLHLVGRHGQPLAPRDFVEHERSADRLRRRVSLTLAELLPVDVRLHRIDLLVDQPADELLHAAIDLTLE